MQLMGFSTWAHTVSHAVDGVPDKLPRAHLQKGKDLTFKITL
jgi:hypothetical protein